MKIKSLFLVLCLVAASASAQFTFLDIDGLPVTNGAVVSFGQGQVGNPAGYYEFFVSNDTSEAIFMKAELVSAENADGSSFEICFGLCYTDITVGQKFPNNGSVFIDAGTQTPSGNHLVNTLDNDTPMNFAFRFYQTDQAGTTELGNDFLITYRFDPTLGVTDNAFLDFNISATLVGDYIETRSPESYTLSIYNKRGRSVKKKRITTQTNRLIVEDLPPGMYFVRVVNDQNASKTIKIIKK
tara:strand:- start:3499 stop:4221 length:723 start_codon:yes stop_codon:yes gene_type:complete